MTMRRVALLGLGLYAAAVACASPPAPAPSPAASIPPAPPASTPKTPAAPEPPPPAEPPAPPPPPPPGLDHHSAAACQSDAECGFDDPCLPRRCLAAVDHRDRKCSETAPPPGRCSCFAGKCTLEPNEEPQPDGPCEVRGCKVDLAGGRCVADTGGVAENLRHNAGVNQGPSCDCIEPAKGCQYTWYAPVPCQSKRDCWVAEEPRPHPVPRPRHLRGRRFRPCHDGEIAPQCSKAGVCVLGLSFGC